MRNWKKNDRDPMERLEPLDTVSYAPWKKPSLSVIYYVVVTV